MFWPYFMLRSALEAAASTIKNPASAGAQKLRLVILSICIQARITYANDPEFQQIFK